MTHDVTTHTTPIIPVHDEMILVVKRSLLFEQGAFQGFSASDMNDMLTLIQKHQEFHPRSIMENDSTYKQIIPYLIFKHNDTYFLMQRHKKASEQRLHSKFSLGIGGHVRCEDITGTTLFEWARREFEEEVEYTGTVTITPLGILNDDSNPVGQVHIGLVLLVEGNSADISVKSELQSGQLLTKTECLQYHDRMESWSKIIINEL
jgi:predicted NUDIX family phosphoesterase